VQDDAQPRSTGVYLPKVARVDFINLPFQHGVLPETEGPDGGDTEVAVGCVSLSDPNDLMYSVKGMYRILDLISEMGSGGLGMAHVSVLTRCPSHCVQQWKRSSSTKDR